MSRDIKRERRCVRLYKSGLSLDEVGKKVFFTRQNVHRILKKRGVKCRNHKQSQPRPPRKFMALRELTDRAGLKDKQTALSILALRCPDVIHSWKSQWVIPRSKFKETARFFKREKCAGCGRLRGRIRVRTRFCAPCQLKGLRE